MTPLRARLSRLRARVPRRAYWLAGIVAAYLVVEQLFAWATRSVGLLSPGGSPHYGVLALGALFLALRLTTFFVVPWLAVAFVVHGALTHRGSPSKSQGS